jgi:hypothetical protein
MSVTSDVIKKFRSYIERLSKLHRDRGIKSPLTLVLALRKDKEFRVAWLAIWKDAAVQNGGKLTLGTVLAILGASLGGVGIAMLGGAIGLPLMAVLGTAGVLAGSEVDALISERTSKALEVQLPPEAHAALGEWAAAMDMTPEDVATQAILDFLEMNQTAMTS